jgi:hypothetical protein
MANTVAGDRPNFAAISSEQTLSAFRNARNTAFVGCFSIPACRNGLNSTSSLFRATFCIDTFIA